MAVWVTVRDKTTGHHYDVGLERYEQLRDRGAVAEVRRHLGRSYPPKLNRPIPTPPARAKTTRPETPAGAATEMKEESS